VGDGQQGRPLTVDRPTRTLRQPNSSSALLSPT